MSQNDFERVQKVDYEGNKVTRGQEDSVKGPWDHLGDHGRAFLRHVAGIQLQKEGNSNPRPDQKTDLALKLAQETYFKGIAAHGKFADLDAFAVVLKHHEQASWGKTKQGYTDTEREMLQKVVTAFREGDLKPLRAFEATVQDWKSYELTTIGQAAKNPNLEKDYDIYMMLQNVGADYQQPVQDIALDYHEHKLGYKLKPQNRNDRTIQRAAFEAVIEDYQKIAELNPEVTHYGNKAKFVDVMRNYGDLHSRFDSVRRAGGEQARAGEANAAKSAAQAFELLKDTVEKLKLKSKGNQSRETNPLAGKGTEVADIGLHEATTASPTAVKLAQEPAAKETMRGG